MSADKGQITVIGGGLAGCEAAWQAAQLGVRVALYEMKPQRFSPAHELPQLGELVCSNSLRSNAVDSAAGLLKEEMRRLGSLVMRARRQHCGAGRNGTGGEPAAVRHLSHRSDRISSVDHNPP